MDLQNLLGRRVYFICLSQHRAHPVVEHDLMEVHHANLVQLGGLQGDLTTRHLGYYRIMAAKLLLNIYFAQAVSLPNKCIIKGCELT